MQKLLRCLLFAVVAAGVATTAAAGELTLTMANGRVTVIAKDVPLRQILAEWARVGNTRMVNAEKLMGGPLTLQLVDVPEKEALDILLRSAAGYMTAPRETALPGASLYDRVIILATSRPPVGGVTAPPAPFGGNRPVMPQPLPPQPPPDDDDGEPRDLGPVPPPGLQNPGMPFPGPTPGINNPNANPNMNPNMPANAPVTSPRPGMLPQPQPNSVNPYAPQPLGPNGRPLPGSTGRGGGPGGERGPGVDDH
jgi:hypothetical protein